MNPKTNDLIEALQSQVADLEKVSALISAAEIAVLDRKQQVAQTHEALQAIEAAIAQKVLADVTLTNESKRQNAMRDARAQDADCVDLAKRFRDCSHALAIDQQHVTALNEQRKNLLVHSASLQRAAELLAAQLHEQAQGKRQMASQQFLQGSLK